MFINDIAYPAYFDLDPDSFYRLVQNRPVGELWLIDFYAEWCGPCKRLLPEIRQLAKDTQGILKVGKVDCTKDINVRFCKRRDVKYYPEIRLYPVRHSVEENPTFIEFSGHDTALNLFFDFSHSNFHEKSSFNSHAVELRYELDPP